MNEAHPQPARLTPIEIENFEKCRSKIGELQLTLASTIESEGVESENALALANRIEKIRSIMNAMIREDRKFVNKM